MKSVSIHPPSLILTPSWTLRLATLILLAETVGLKVIWLIVCLSVVILNTWKQTIANGIMESSYLVCDFSPCVPERTVLNECELCRQPTSASQISLTVQAVSFNPYVCVWLHSCDSWLYEVIWQSHLYSNVAALSLTHTLDLIRLICQKDALNALKVLHKLKNIQQDMDYMVSMVTLW